MDRSGLHPLCDVKRRIDAVLQVAGLGQALNAFTILFAKELRPEGFRVNSVSPRASRRQTSTGTPVRELGAGRGERGLEIVDSLQLLTHVTKPCAYYLALARRYAAASPGGSPKGWRA